jgi:hypothetical protein
VKAFQSAAVKSVETSPDATPENPVKSAGLDEYEPPEQFDIQLLCEAHVVHVP